MTSALIKPQTSKMTHMIPAQSVTLTVRSSSPTRDRDSHRQQPTEPQCSEEVTTLSHNCCLLFPIEPFVGK